MFQHPFIEGTPTIAGLKNVQFTVKDSSFPTPQEATASMGLRVTSTLTITSSAVLPTARLNQAISPVVLKAASGASPYKWAVQAGNLPSGITLDPATGQLTGTPTAAGEHVFTVKVTDNAQATAEKEFIYHVAAPLTIGTNGVPDGGKGEYYSYTVPVSGGRPLTRWRVSSGSLPAGLTLDAATGTISGTPTSGTTLQFTLEVADSDDPAQVTSKTFTINIFDKLYLTNASPPNGRLEQAYSTAITARLGTPPYTYRIAAGLLPDGLTLAAQGLDALIAGTPSKAGTYIFTVEAADDSTPKQTVTQQYTVTVHGLINIDTTKLANALKTTTYDQSVAASGGTPPYRWQVKSGHLPAGLNLDPATGRITGSATSAPGLSTEFTIEVTDAGVPAAPEAKLFSIYVLDPLALTTQTLPGALQKEAYQFTLAGSGGLQPLAWSKAAGSLPEGLSFDAGTATLTGTPRECGSFPITLGLHDASPTPMTVEKAYTIEVTCSNDYLLTGKVSRNGDCGSAMTGVTLTLQGPTPAITKTGVCGSYSFTGLAHGDYTLTPQKGAHIFEPAAATAHIGNDMAIDFRYYTAETLDSDNDGMPDLWETAHGLNPVHNDALADKDGDGVNNLEEFLEGLDPTTKDALISGLVKNSAGSPVANARVDAFLQDKNIFRGAETDGNGSYRIVVPVFDGYRVVVWQTGEYQTRFFDNADNWSEASEVNVTAGSQGSIDFTLTRGATITGTVAGLKTGETATIEAWSQEAANFNHTIVTGNGGAVNFTLAGLAEADDYVLWLTAVGYAEGFVAANGALTSMERAGHFASGATGVVITLQAGHAIAGAIHGLETGAAALVSTSSASTGSSASVEVVAEADPTPYTLTGLADGPDYIVNLWAPGYSSGAWKGDFGVPAAPVPYEDGEAITLGNADRTGVDFTLTAGHRVSGSVHKLGLDEFASIEAWSEATGQWRGTTVIGAGAGTDAYTLTGLPMADDYRIHIAADGYLTGFYGATGLTGYDDATRLDAATDHSAIDFTLARGFTISGIVTGLAAGERAEITAWSEATRAWASTSLLGTGADISYTLSGLPAAADFLVRFNGRDCAPQSRDDIDSSLNPTNVHFIAMQGYTISGTVTKAGAYGVVTVDVTGGGTNRTTVAMADGSGTATYQVSALPGAGDYLVCASSAGRKVFYQQQTGLTAATRVNLTQGDRGRIDFDLSLVTPHRLQGQLSGVLGNNMVWIDAWDDATGAWGGTERHGNGGFAIDLPAGSYKVAFTGHDNAEVYWQADGGNGQALVTLDISSAGEVDLTTTDANLHTIPLVAGYRLSGRGCRDKNGSTTCDQDELLGDVPLEVSGTANRTAISGSNGQYSINGLPAGHYRVYIRSLHGTLEKSLTINSDTTQDLILSTTTTGSIKGQVTRNGSGIGDAFIRIFDGSNLFVNALMSETDGSFSYQGLTPGNYTIDVDTDMNGVNEAENIPAAVAAGQETVVPIVIQ